jgi:hypothetical protein
MNTAEATLLDTAAAHLRDRDLTVAIKEARRDERIDAWFRVTGQKSTRPMSGFICWSKKAGSESGPVATASQGP